MLALQASIGAYNDLVDAPTDAITRPAKPLPAGEVSRADARGMTIVGLAVGLLLAALLGTLAFATAAIGVGCGYVHSRWTKGTALAPLPFALGIALLPTFAWIVATGELPPAIVVVLAGGGGVAIALANAGADATPDSSAGIRTPAVRLGVRRTNLLVTLLMAIVATVGIATLAGLRPGPVPLTLTVVGLGLLGAGLILAWRPSRRPQLAWELDAAGLAVLGIAWLSAASESP